MKIFLSMFVLLSLNTLALAETVHLKDGNTITGKILERTSESIKLDSNGAISTYFADEIKDVDGQPLVSKIVVNPPSPAQNNVQPADDPGEKRKLILQFIEVFGTKRVMGENFDTMLQMLAQQKPQEAAQLRNRIKVDEIIERLIPLYDKHFSSQDLKTYIEFYSSAVGKKLIVNISEIMKESIDISTAYMKEKFPELAEKE